MILNCILCSCQSGQQDFPADTGPVTEAQTDAVISTISAADLSSYYVIRADKADDELCSEVTDFMLKLREKAGNSVMIQTDFYVPGIAACEIHELEIIVGATEREESVSFLKDLKVNDYGYALYGKKLVIAGGCDTATFKAINLFTTNILDRFKDGSEIFYSSEDDTVVHAKYNIDKLNISLMGNEIPVENFRIVYSNDNKASSRIAAESLAEAIEQQTGYMLDVICDRESSEPSAHEILIGNTNRDDSAYTTKDEEYVITFNEKHIRIYGNGTAELMAGASDISKRFENRKEEKLTIVPDNCQITITRDYLTAMSFNNLVSSVTDERQSAVIGMIRKYMPDTLGMQESSPSWMTYLKTNLSDMYAVVGTGRDGGNSGEYNPIFYNKTKFTLLDSGTKWLSDTPDIVSKYEESSLNRIYTYALLQRKSDSKKILVVNTHFDHKSAEARTKQGKVLAAFLKSNSQYPIVLTGDFNTTSDAQAYKEVLAGGVSDSKAVAATVSGGSTFTSFGKASKIIDFIFVNSARIAVNSYRVCNENINNVTPSDHHPVYIEYIVY